MLCEDTGSWNEEDELRTRLEYGDIVHGDDPRRPPLIPRGNGYYAQLFWGVYDPRLYIPHPPPAVACSDGGGKTPEHLHSIVGLHIQRLMDATSYLNYEYGVVFNTHIVIAHELAGITNHDDASKLLWLFFHRLRKWFKRKKLEAFYVYVHENSPRNGFHTHILLHVDSAVIDSFKVWLPRAVALLYGSPLPNKMLHIVYRRQRNFSHQVTLQWIWVRYLLKGILPGLEVEDVETGTMKSVQKALRIRPRPGGIVLCRKRVGVSSNIGKKASRKAGYKSMFLRGYDDRLYSGEEFKERAERLVQMEVCRVYEELRVFFSG